MAAIVLRNMLFPPFPSQKQRTSAETLRHPIQLTPQEKVKFLVKSEIISVMQTRAVDWSEVGPRIRHLRREQGLTQKQLIEPTASASFLSLIESGVRQPSQEVLGHIASRLGLEPDELVTGRSRHAEIQVEIQLQEAREQLRLANIDEAAERATRAASEAHHLGLTRVEAKCYEVLASVEERRNVTDSALAFYRKAELLWSDEPAHLRFQTVAGIARCMQALGDARYGIHMLESYLLELERDGLPDPMATMRTHSVLVICYSALGLTAQAAEAADKAQALAPRVSDTEQLACMNMNVTHSLFAQGRIEDTLNAIRQAEMAYLSLGWEVDAAGAKLNRAVVQIEKGDLDQARQNLTEAVEAFKGANQPSDVAKALNELGRVERLSGNVSQAEDLLRDAQQHLDGGDFSERGLNFRELGLCVEERDPESAKGHLRRAIDLYMITGATTEIAATYRLLGDLHRKLGEVDQAADAYRAGLETIEARPETPRV